MFPTMRLIGHPGAVLALAQDFYPLMEISNYRIVKQSFSLCLGALFLEHREQVPGDLAFGFAVFQAHEGLDFFETELQILKGLN